MFAATRQQRSPCSATMCRCVPAERRHALAQLCPVVRCCGKAAAAMPLRYLASRTLHPPVRGVLLCAVSSCVRFLLRAASSCARHPPVRIIFLYGWCSARHPPVRGILLYALPPVRGILRAQHPEDDLVACDQACHDLARASRRSVAPLCTGQPPRGSRPSRRWRQQPAVWSPCPRLCPAPRQWARDSVAAAWELRVAGCARRAGRTRCCVLAWWLSAAAPAQRQWEQQLRKTIKAAACVRRSRYSRLGGEKTAGPARGRPVQNVPVRGARRQGRPAHRAAPPARSCSGRQQQRHVAEGANRGNGPAAAPLPRAPAGLWALSTGGDPVAARSLSTARRSQQCRRKASNAEPAACNPRTPHK